MVNKKREHMQVIKDILNAIRESREIKPTRLLYASNLSPQMFKDYMDELVNKSFVNLKTDEEGKKTISITKKGNSFLEEYRVIEKFIDNFGL